MPNSWWFWQCKSIFFLEVLCKSVLKNHHNFLSFILCCVIFLYWETPPFSHLQFTMLEKHELASMFLSFFTYSFFVDHNFFSVCISFMIHPSIRVAWSSMCLTNCEQAEVQILAVGMHHLPLHRSASASSLQIILSCLAHFLAQCLILPSIWV